METATGTSLPSQPGETPQADFSCQDVGVTAESCNDGSLNDTELHSSGTVESFLASEGAN